MAGIFGNGFGQRSSGGLLGGLFDPQALLTVGGALLSGRTPSDSWANLGTALPAYAKTRKDDLLTQARQTALTNWIKSRSTGPQALAPDTSALLQNDPDMAKTFIEDSIKPVAEKPQGLMSVGNDSSVYDPATHTFTANPNASPTAKYGNAPSGYRFKSDGALEPISGGPSDPNTVNMLSPEALDLVSTQYLAGDKSSITGFARNPTMRAQLTNAIAAKAAALGMDGKAVAAEISAYGGNVSAQRSAGTRAAQVGMAASEANQMADIALEASRTVPRETFVPWNQAVNAWRTGTSSPDMAAFVTATTSLVNAYARAVSPLGAPTDAMRQHAEEMLNTAQGPDAYAAVIAQMKKEMEAALNAPAEISDRLKADVSGQEASPPQAPQATTNGALPDPLGIR